MQLLSFWCILAELRKFFLLVLKPPMETLSLRRVLFGQPIALAIGILPLLLTITAASAPVAVDDQYQTAEDLVLNTQSGPLISTDLDSSSQTITPAFDGDWDYLDKMENQLGADMGYPVDGFGRDWNSVDFDVGSSTVGPWGSG
ncbi:MAG TPA: hypothetical protein DCQ96_09575, partial [Verrucomicrobiales bacterium]|nr:hypothetical protein [Verrucomicrobiales bacterium]